MIINRFPGMSNSGGGNPYNIIAQSQTSAGVRRRSLDGSVMVGDVVITSYPNYTWNIKSEDGLVTNSGVPHRSQSYYMSSYAYVGNDLYYCLRYAKSSAYSMTVYKWDGSAFVSIGKPSISETSYNGEIFGYNGKLYLMDRTNSKFYSYSNGAWSSASAMGLTIYGLGYTLPVEYNSKLYFFGSASSSGPYYMYTFNGSTFTTNTLPLAQTSYIPFYAVCVKNGLLYVLVYISNTYSLYSYNGSAWTKLWDYPKGFPFEPYQIDMGIRVKGDDRMLFWGHIGAVDMDNDCFTIYEINLDWK